MVVDLFIDLGADIDQLEFPVVFASGLEGIATLDPDVAGTDMQPVFEAIIAHVPPPPVDSEGTPQLQVTTLDYNEYLGRVVIGRIHRGLLRSGQPMALVVEDGTIQKGRIVKLFTFSGLKRIEAETAMAGDIVAIAGFPGANIGDTLCDPETPDALPRLSVDEPTLQMTFAVNDSPFSGREGKFVTSRQLRSRLYRELESNVALRVQDTDSTDAFLVSGRGELHLGKISSRRCGARATSSRSPSRVSSPGRSTASCASPSRKPMSKSLRNMPVPSSRRSAGGAASCATSSRPSRRC